MNGSQLLGCVRLENAKVGDIIHFRCGGKAILTEIHVNQKQRDIDLKLNDEPLCHNYKFNGKDAEAHESIFDIVLVQRMRESKL